MLEWIDPVDGIITSSFGSRSNPILKKDEFHNGIDIGVAEGSDAVAVKGGKVIEVRASKTLGNLITYETNDGYIITYAHLQEALLKVGDKVVKGQVIAKTGNTGLSTGPHLHYSIQYKGEFLDPIQYVNLTYTTEVVQEYADRGVKESEIR